MDELTIPAENRFNCVRATTAAALTAVLASVFIIGSAPTWADSPTGQVASSAPATTSPPTGSHAAELKVSPDASPPSTAASSADSTRTHTADSSNAPTAADFSVPQIVAIVAGLIAVGAIISLFFAFNPRDGDAQVWFRRHWGGFGSSSTGWAMSPSLIHLVVAMSLAVMAGVLLLAALQANSHSTNPSAASKPIVKDAAKPAPAETNTQTGASNTGS
jgi:hypothetical protein